MIIYELQLKGKKIGVSVKLVKKYDYKKGDKYYGFIFRFFRCSF